MSKKSSKSRSARVSSYNANRRLHQTKKYKTMTRQLDLFDVSPSKTRLRQYEDRRTYHPLGDVAPPKTLQGKLARIIANKTNHTVFEATNLKSKLPNIPSPIAVAFSQPENVLVCVRRKIRKEVLHALKLNGRNGSARSRRNSNSDIRC